MPSVSPKVEIPLPVNGVLKGINPRLIGPTGLTDSRNWIFRDGSFHTRDGLRPLGESVELAPAGGIINLFGTDELAEPNTEFPFCAIHIMSGGMWIVNPNVYDEVFGYGISSVAVVRSDGYPLVNDSLSHSSVMVDGPEYWYLSPTSPPDVLTEYYGCPNIPIISSLGYVDCADGNLVPQMGTWAPGDPDFLGEAGDDYLSLIFEAADVADCCIRTPFVELPIQGDEYELRLKVASTATNKFIKIIPISFKYTGYTQQYSPEAPEWYLELAPDYTPVLTGTTYQYGQPIDHLLSADTVAAPDWSDNNELVATVDLSDYPDHTHLGMIVVMEAEASAEIAIGQAQISWGTGNTYRLPSATPTDPGTGKISVYERPMGITQFDATQDETITVMGTTDGWHKLETDLTWTALSDGTPGSDQPPLTASDKISQVVFRVFDDGGATKKLVGCNSNDPNMVWDGASQYYAQIENQYDADVPVDGPDHEQTITSKCMAVTFNRLMYGNITVDFDTPPASTPVSYPDGIIHTQALSYDEWKPSDIVRLADTPGPITAMQEMGNQLTAIYKTDAIYVAQAQGGAIPFSFQLKAAHITGPASPLAVVPIDEGLHVYLALDGDLVIFDGVRPRSLTPTAHNVLQKLIDFKNIRQSFGFYDRARKELYFVFPPANAEDPYGGIMVSMVNPQQPTVWPLQWQFPVSAGGFTYVNQSKLIRELEGTIGNLEGTIASFARYSPNTLFCSADATNAYSLPEGVAYVQSSGADYQGDIEAYFTTGLYDFGEMTRYKTVKEIDHLFVHDGDADVEVSLTTADYGGASVPADTSSVSLSEGPFISSHRQTGRLFQLSMATDAGKSIEWLGSEASIHPRGLR